MHLSPNTFPKSFAEPLPPSPSHRPHTCSGDRRRWRRGRAPFVEPELSLLLFLNKLPTQTGDEPLRKNKQESIKKKPILKRLACLTDSDVSTFLRDLDWIADTLERGYALRCIADYEPERAVARRDDTFALDGITITEMQGWKRKAQVSCNRAVKVFNALG